METLEIYGISQPKIVFEALLEECHTSFPVLISAAEYLESNQSLEISMKRELSGTLHKLRGSFGFTGFQDICNIARKCEHDLKNDSSETRSSLSRLLEELRKLSQEIETALQ
jgi:HPt (histidine-containing phosphotransfer) domain-containing protein